MLLTTELLASLQRNAVRPFGGIASSQLHPDGELHKEPIGRHLGCVWLERDMHGFALCHAGELRLCGAELVVLRGMLRSPAAMFGFAAANVLLTGVRFGAAVSQCSSQVWYSFLHASREP